MLQTDPTIALRLAEAACKITTVPTREAQSAFEDILRKKCLFYKESLEKDKGSFALSPDWKFKLTQKDDNTVQIWNFDGTLRQSFEVYGVTSAAFSSDGKFVVIGKSNAVELWNLDEMLEQSFEGHSSAVLSVAFSHVVSSFAFSPERKLIATGSGVHTIKIWNLDGTLKQSFGEENNDDQNIYSDSLAARLTGFNPNKFENLSSPEDKLTSVTFSPDGRFILAAGIKTAKLWNLDGSLIHSFEAHTNCTLSVAFSPDGKLILAGGDTPTLWNIDGTLTQSLKSHNSEATAVAFSPDGKFMLAGSYNTVVFWNLDGTLWQLFELAGMGEVLSIALSPNGKSMLTEGWNTAKILEFRRQTIF